LQPYNTRFYFALPRKGWDDPHNKMLRVVTFAALCAFSVACTTNEDCSLLGKCSGGSCTCFPGWTGVACSRADLAPLDPTLGYHNSSASSWGGRAILDPKSGRWQLLATEIARQCPLIMFEYNSQVIRAVSDGGPGGPYRHAEVILPPFHHNPTIAGPTPDGMYLLFYIGADNVTNEQDCSGASLPFVPLPCSPRCTNGSFARQNQDSNQYITMAWTADLVAGPWKQRVVLRDNHGNPNSWHCSENNPAAHILPNGTVVLVYRANACNASAPTHGEHLGVAVADHWSAEFVRDDGFIMAPEDPAVSHGTNNEDPFLFALPDGSWHIVSHQQSAGNLCGTKDAGSSCGAHFWARNPHGPWTMSPEAVYDENVTLVNGSAARFQTRQRPQLVFAADGSYRPLFLFTSGSFDGSNDNLAITTHTYAHAFKSD